MELKSLSLTTPTQKEKTQASALRELRDSFPQYADAISGDNPPYHPSPNTPQPPTGRIAAYKWIVPGICGLFIVATTLSAINLLTTTNTSAILSQGVATQAVAFSIIALFFGTISFRHGVNIEREYYASLPPPPAPHQMELIREPFTVQTPDADFHLLLEYEITATQKGHVRASSISSMKNTIALQTNNPELLEEQRVENVFHKLITAKFTDCTTEYIKQTQKKYVLYCQKNDTPLDPKIFGALIDKDEIEYYLAAPFGQAAYEANIPVFRYRVKVKYELPPPLPAPPPAPPPTRNVVIGELIDIREIYSDGKIPDPWG